MALELRASRTRNRFHPPALELAVLADPELSDLDDWRCLQGCRGECHHRQTRRCNAPVVAPRGRARPFRRRHFIGHGGWNANSKRFGLVLRSESGNVPAYVSDDRLREILTRRGLRMVFLNTCDSGAGSGENFGTGDAESMRLTTSTVTSDNMRRITGAAQHLSSRGIPVVVANQLKVVDVSAVVFAREFYYLLPRGRSYAQAKTEARVATR